jgi:hypothetical protein
VKKFEMSHTMKIASVWVAWAFLGIGALGGALFVVLDHFGVKEQAGWAQAFGAVLAIVGAAAFPYIHEADRRRQKADGLRKVLLLLARNQTEQLRLLHSTLYNAPKDWGADTINPYLKHGWHLKWPPHVEALRSIPIAELDPGQVHILGELKVAAGFAEEVIARIDDWDIFGEREQDDIKRLQHYHQMAVLAVVMLDRKAPAA